MLSQRSLRYLRTFMPLKDLLQYHCCVKVISKQESQSTVMRNYTCLFHIYTGCCVQLQPLLPQGVFNIQHINPTCLKFSRTKNTFSNKLLVLRITFSTVVRNQIITFICQIQQKANQMTIARHLRQCLLIQQATSIMDTKYPR